VLRHACVLVAVQVEEQAATIEALRAENAALRGAVPRGPTARPHGAALSWPLMPPPGAGRAAAPVPQQAALPPELELLLRRAAHSAAEEADQGEAELPAGLLGAGAGPWGLFPRARQPLAMRAEGPAAAGASQGPLQDLPPEALQALLQLASGASAGCADAAAAEVAGLRWRAAGEAGGGGGKRLRDAAGEEACVGRGVQLKREKG
jgi:hypothetical protein